MENQIVEFEQTNTQCSVYSDLNLYGQWSKVAESLAKSEIVPSNFRGKPESCLIAIDIARQIGARSPLFVMQNLYVVNGKPSWSGQYCCAIVRANFTNVHLRWKGKEDEDGYGCQVIATDKFGNECIGTWVTMKMAKAEGWIDKPGSKWKTMPIQMLQYRAHTFFARIYCPEKLLGLHDEFEQEDIRQGRSQKTIDLERKLTESEEQ